LSPNLFLLVADILQDLIKTDGGIRHPMADGLCPGLQYADDTIILVKAELGDITRLKNLLDMFSSATRLAINYDKSTVTPLHLKDGALDQLLEILHCKVGTFPQIYLGLPLSNLKLQLFDFTSPDLSARHVLLDLLLAVDHRLRAPHLHTHKPKDMSHT
jgi:hypothetical protein